MTQVTEVKKLVSKSLGNCEKNEFRKILDEPLSLDEKLTAIYLRSLQAEYFDSYKPIFKPYKPHGWEDEHAIYKSSKPGEKSAIWKDISERFSGYIKSVDAANAENNSNMYFLKEMLAHFEKMGMPKQAETVKQRIQEFEYAKNFQ